MKMISEQEVRRIAALARLKLNQKEMEKMRKDLSVILAFFQAIKKIDTKGIEPGFYSIPLANVFRDDKARQDKSVNRILEQAPRKKRGFIKVKEILK